MKTIAVYCGGKSSEHSIALASARNVIDNIDRGAYEVMVVGVDRDGVMRLHDPDSFTAGDEISSLELASPISGELSINPTQPELKGEDGQAYTYDVAFPVFHGPYGEGGNIQGLFEIQGVDYVGPGLLSSALCMDKIIFKRLCQQAGLPVATYVAWDTRTDSTPNWDDLVEQLGGIVYVKPSRSGSSIGVSRAENQQQYAAALDRALKEDTRIIVEAAVDGREVECAVLGDLPPRLQVSGVGEIMGDFYSFDEKYSDSSSTAASIQADLDPQMQENIRQMCVKLALLFSIRGLSRIDFFIRQSDGEVMINEINTIPGFTAISLYPKLWEAAGLTQTQLVTKLIESASKEG